MHIVLIKPDGIGDYFLYRNFPPLIKKHFGADCTITGLLSPSIRGFADILDRNVWDKILWFDPKKLISHKTYLIKWQFLTKTLRADIVVYPVISRYSPVDWLVSRISAKQKIGSVNDLKCMSAERARETDTFYSRLIPYYPDRPRFEFYSYQDFFGGWLNDNPPLSPLWHRDTFPSFTHPGKGSYVMLFPGAGQPYRKWPADWFGLVARYIIERYRLPVWVAGSDADQESAKVIVEAGGSAVNSVCGKMRLVNVASMVKDASLVIANDSGPMHLAALLGVPLIGISSTRDYGRYHPYPVEFGLKARFVYPLSSCVLPWEDETRLNIAKVHSEDGHFKVSDVSVDQVLEALDSLLALSNITPRI